MAFDNLIECSRCGGDACYVQEVTKDIQIELCYGCGFQSNSLMKKDTEFFFEQMQVLPDLYKALMDEEEDGKVWMPTTINVEDKGMIFADGSSRDNWAWAGVKAIDVIEEEKTKYPIPGKEGEYYKKRMDMSTIQHFKENDFIEALSYIGILPK